ncbi:hypothetical protein PAPYR_8967 [Paratrimastix pyriformis]|uniref:TRAF-type domain-containing protein n=1 Tax=Paratrimastix pyriformis TaxID=342808 RepID=A0ABQ8UBZ6_9EUKA|nr:hypothetical protein PAPYR_8967 [Paratrimastix pyriformis]
MPMDQGSNDCSEKKPACRPRKQLDYVIVGSGADETGDALLPTLKIPFVCDIVCRPCAAMIGGVCPTCGERITEQVTNCRMAQRHVEKAQCLCPNKTLGCAATVGVLAVENHLRLECEWREEECPRCHRLVRHALMAQHQDTDCLAKPVPCGYADVGCETRCPQGDLAVHERDGQLAHMDLLRQRLVGTARELAATQAALAQATQQLDASKSATGQRLDASEAALRQTQQDLAQTRADLGATKGELAQAMAALAELRAWVEQATLDESTRQVSLVWQPGTPAPACSAAAAAVAQPTLYRVTLSAPVAAAVAVAAAAAAPVTVHTGPECHCTYVMPQEAREAGFVVVAVRGSLESAPSASVTVSQATVFTYDHDMDDRGLFYYLGTQGRTQPWQNPAEAGWVTVTRSSEDQGKASDALGRQPCNSCTGDGVPNSWWQFDLGAERLFTPTRFPARYFRLISTGPNVGGCQEMNLSGFEMYGTLREYES